MTLLHPELDKCHSYLSYRLADREKYTPPERFAEYLSEKCVSEVSSLIRELTGVHPSLWEFNQLGFESLLHLA